jgi:hypothetical protein
MVSHPFVESFILIAPQNQTLKTPVIHRIINLYIDPVD